MKKVGRKKIEDRSSVKSFSMSIVMTQALNDKLLKIAGEERMARSSLAREILEEYTKERLGY